MSGDRKRLLVFILAYNEEQSLPGLVEELLRCDAPAGFDREIIVVDDGSRDSTAEAAVRMGVRVLRLPINVGIGGAEQTGLLYARRCGFDVAVRIDGDGQHPPEGIAPLVREVAEGGADLAIGSRFLETGSGGSKSTWARRIGIRFFSELCALLTRRRVTDPTSGFRCFGRRSIDLLTSLPAQDFPEVEFLMEAARKRLAVKEVSVPFRSRRGGVSFIRPHRAAYFMVKVTLATFVASLRAE